MKAFDNKLYIDKEVAKIKERLKYFDKLYLEVGGKLFDDNHAARCVPGFLKDNKIKILKSMKKDLEIIICVSAKSIDAKKEREDYGITYDEEAIRMIKYFKENIFKIAGVCITLYNNEDTVKRFERRIKDLGLKTYIHTFTKGYPSDIDMILSSEGYGKNSFIETSKKIILVTAPGASSGKLATSLSQIYHEYKRGLKAGYAKLETFPVYNLPLDHPLNIAYEAATIDIGDKNMIDNFHLKAYGISTVNYNRDIEVFPIIKSILDRITSKDLYKSPTDMGINYLKDAITNIDIVEKASKEEIARRYLETKVAFRENKLLSDKSEAIKLMMYNLNMDENIIPGREKILNLSKKRNLDMAIITLNKKQITGKESPLLSASSALFLNTLKYLAKIPDDIMLLPENILKAIQLYKQDESIKINELMMILVSQEMNNPSIKKAIGLIPKLKNKKMHVTYIIDQAEKAFIKGLGITLSMEDKFKKQN